MKQLLTIYMDAGLPLYARWAHWCWHKPIYTGLLLLPLFIIIMVVDIFLLFYYFLAHWGDKQW